MVWRAPVPSPSEKFSVEVCVSWIEEKILKNDMLYRKRKWTDKNYSTNGLFSLRYNWSTIQKRKT